MEGSQQKDYSFLGNDTFPSLYDAQVYERKIEKEYLERQFYEQLLKSEPSIEKLIENKSDLSKLSTLSELLTLYHLKKRATKRSRRAREPSRIPLAFLRGLNKKNSMLKNFVFKKISKIEIPKSSKLHRYVHKVRKLYHARYKCKNERDPKIINVNKIAIPKKAYLLSFFSRHYHKTMKLKCKVPRSIQSMESIIDDNRYQSIPIDIN